MRRHRKSSKSDKSHVGHETEMSFVNRVPSIAVVSDKAFERRRLKSLCSSIPESSNLNFIPCSNAIEALSAMSDDTVFLGILDKKLAAEVEPLMIAKNPHLLTVIVESTRDPHLSMKLKTAMTIACLTFQYLETLKLQRGAWH